MAGVIFLLSIWNHSVHHHVCGNDIRIVIIASKKANKAIFSPASYLPLPEPYLGIASILY